MRRFLILLVILILLGVGGWFVYQRYWLPRQAAAQKPTYETINVQRDKIASTVSATGNIEPESQTSLSFRSAGRIDKVLITAGQPVAKGQLLASLDTTELALALAQAKVSLQISQAQLAKLAAPPSQKDLTNAQAAVEVARASVAGADATLNSAQASYRQLLASTSPEQKTVNEAQVHQAEANVKQAQQAYNQVKDLPNVT